MSDVDKTLRGKGAVPTPPGFVIIGDYLDQIETARAVCLTSDDPEGPHKLRVGLRRLRSALWFFRPLLSKTVARRLSDEARWLGQEVGALRDLDVLWRETIAPLAKSKPEDKGLAALDAVLSSATLRVQVATRKTLLGPRVGRFLSDCRMLLDATTWKRVDVLADALLPLAKSALDKRLARARTLGDHFDTLDIDDRHAFRKDLKKLRYSAEIARSLYGRHATADFVKQLKKIQDRLGVMNDAAVAEEILTVRLAELADDDPARIAAEALIDRLNAGVVLDAPKVRAMWHKLARRNVL